MRPQRSIDLDDPYIGMADGSGAFRGPEVGDENPVAGEVGLELFKLFDTDLTNAGATATGRVIGPVIDETFTCTVKTGRVAFTTAATTLADPGRHRVILTVSFPGGGVRKIARMLYVNGI